MPQQMSLEMSLLAFLLLSVALLALGVLVLSVSRLRETKLIGLGLVCAVIAIGYASMVPAAINLAPVLMKIGVLLVLGGLASSLFTHAPGPDSDMDRSGMPWQ